jgi:hypothetical protein
LDLVKLKNIKYQWLAKFECSGSLRGREQASKTARKFDPPKANSGLRRNWLSLSE